MAAGTMREELDRHRIEGAASPTARFDMPVDPLVDDTYCRLLSADLSAHGAWERFVARPNLADGGMIPDEPGLYMFVWRPRLRWSLASQRDPGAEEDKRPKTEGEYSPSYVLYVGKAGDGNQNTLRRRFKQEYSKIINGEAKNLWTKGDLVGRPERLSYFLALRPLEFWVLPCKENLSELEKRLIHTLNPPACKSGRRKQLGPPKPAF